MKAGAVLTIDRPIEDAFGGIDRLTVPAVDDLTVGDRIVLFGSDLEFAQFPVELIRDDDTIKVGAAIPWDRPQVSR